MVSGVRNLQEDLLRIQALEEDAKATDLENNEWFVDNKTHVETLTIAKEAIQRALAAEKEVAIKLLERLKTAEARVEKLEARLIDSDTQSNLLAKQCNLAWDTVERGKVLVAIASERIKELTAVAQALLECERNRRRDMPPCDVGPDQRLYLKAVELARKAMEGGE